MGDEEEDSVGKGNKIILSDDPGYDTEEYLLSRMKSKGYEKLHEEIGKFIDETLEECVHYGPSDSRSEKRTLLQPGAQAFSQKWAVEPVFLQDIKTWEMLGSMDGRVCYTCYLMTPKKKIKALELIVENNVEFAPYIYSLMAIGEGRGSGNLNERSNSKDNDTVKLTQKRAWVDAVIGVGGLSQFNFTQDYGDPEEEGSVKPEVVGKVDTDGVLTIKAQSEFSADDIAEAGEDEAFRT